MNIFKTSAAILSILAIGGCGGGGGGGGGGDNGGGNGGGASNVGAVNSISRTPGPGRLATDNRTVEQLLNDPNTVFRPVSVGARVDRGEFELSSFGSVTAVSQDADGNFNVTYTVDGTDQTIMFRPQDRDPIFGDFERRVGDNTFIAQEGGIPGSTLDYVAFLIAGRADNTQSGFITVGALGPRTPTPDLPTGPVRYEGGVSGSFVQDPDAMGAQPESLEGDFAMRVNFDTGNVNGRFADVVITNTDDTTVPLAGRLNMTGTITDGAFDGTLREAGAPDGSAIDGMTGAFAGDIFGPNGDETGGVFNGTTDDATVFGAFGGAR